MRCSMAVRRCQGCEKVQVEAENVRMEEETQRRHRDWTGLNKENTQETRQGQTHKGKQRNVHYMTQPKNTSDLPEHPLENAGMLHSSAFLKIWWLWQFWCFFRHQKSRKFPHLSQVQMKKESSLLQLLLKDPMLDFMIWIWLTVYKTSLPSSTAFTTQILSHSTYRFTHPPIYPQNL